MRFRSKLSTPACALLMLASCHEGLSQSARAGDLDVSLAIDPDPPVAGENELRLRIHDASGHSVERAKIAFEYDMPAMGSMPEMKGGGDVVEKGGGEYSIRYPLAMLGDWTLSMTIAAPDHPPVPLRLKVSPPHKGFVMAGGGARGASTSTASRGHVLEIPIDRQQRIGVTFATVEERKLEAKIRAFGHVAVDERKLQDVTLKYEAYIQKLEVAETGKAVRAGDPLLSLYSPDLLDAERQLKDARRAKEAKTPGSDAVLRAASERLRFWGLSPAEIEAIEAREKADGTITIRSPASGVVLEKAAVEGMHAMPGMMLYRIGNLGRVWVEAEIYESEAPLVAVGLASAIEVSAVPDRRLEGHVTFVAPTVSDKTRTITARIELQNAELRLRPGMFADVFIVRPLGVRLSVLDEALLLSGAHRYAFVDRGEGKLEPVEVEIGARAGELVEVRSGLVAGERVVRGAAFLVASEAQLKDALPRWKAP